MLYGSEIEGEGGSGSRHHQLELGAVFVACAPTILLHMPHTITENGRRARNANNR